MKYISLSIQICLIYIYVTLLENGEKLSVFIPFHLNVLNVAQTWSIFFRNFMEYMFRKIILWFGKKWYCDISRKKKINTVEILFFCAIWITTSNLIIKNSKKFCIIFYFMLIQLLQNTSTILCKLIMLLILLQKKLPFLKF